MNPRCASPWEIGSVSRSRRPCCAITAILWCKPKLRAVLASWWYYGVVLIPVLGIAQSGPQLVADRYSYLPCLSWAVLCGGSLFYKWRRFVDGSTQRGFFGKARYAVAPLTLLVLGALAWHQTAVWRDSNTLWTHAVRIYPNEPRILTNFGDVLVRRGEVDKGIDQFREALHIAPYYSVAHNKLAIALASQGQFPLAIEHYREAIRLSPKYSQAYNNLGVAFALSGDMNQAIEQFRQALLIDPNYDDAQRNLNLALSRRTP